MAGLALAIFHVFLFWDRLVVGDLFDPAIALRWLAAAGLVSALAALRRMGASAGVCGAKRSSSGCWWCFCTPRVAPSRSSRQAMRRPASTPARSSFFPRRSPWSASASSVRRSLGAGLTALAIDRSHGAARRRLSPLRWLAARRHDARSSYRRLLTIVAAASRFAAQRFRRSESSPAAPGAPPAIAWRSAFSPSRGPWRFGRRSSSMHLLVVGMNHRTASLAEREALALAHGCGARCAGGSLAPRTHSRGARHLDLQPDRVLPRHGGSATARPRRCEPRSSASKAPTSCRPDRRFTGSTMRRRSATRSASLVASTRWCSARRRF